MRKLNVGEDSGGQVRDIQNVPSSVLFDRQEDLEYKPQNLEDGASEKIIRNELESRGVAFSSRVPMGVLARQFKAECERTGDPRVAWRLLCQRHGLGNVAPPAEIRRIAGIKPVAAGMGTYDDPAEDPRSPEEAGVEASRSMASRTHTAGRLVAEVSEEIDWNTSGRRIVKSSRHKEAGFYEPWLDDLPEMQQFNDAGFDPDAETVAVCELCGAPNATLDEDTGEYVCSNCRQQGAEIPAVASRRTAADYGPYTGVASCPTCGKECTEEDGQSGVYFCEDCANSQAGGPYFPGPKSGDQPQTASRREGWGSNYSRDPFWLETKWPGECKQCHRPIARGEKAFYYPNGKRLLCDGPCGQAASADFEMGKADEDFMNRAGGRKAADAEGMTDCQLCHGRLDEDQRCKDCGAKYEDNGGVSDMPPLDERWDDVKASRRTAGEPVGYAYGIGGGWAFACPECMAMGPQLQQDNPEVDYATLEESTPLTLDMLNGTEVCEGCGKPLGGDSDPGGGVEASRKTAGDEGLYYALFKNIYPGMSDSQKYSALQEIGADEFVSMVKRNTGMTIDYDGFMAWIANDGPADGPDWSAATDLSQGSPESLANRRKASQPADPLEDKWAHGNGRNCLQSGGDASDAGTATAGGEDQQDADWAKWRDWKRENIPPCQNCGGFGQSPDDAESPLFRMVTCPECGGAGTGGPPKVPFDSGSGTTASYGDPDEGGDDAIPADSPMAPYNPDDYLPSQDVASDCPTCGGPGEPLGGLGNLMHYRCRDCGMDFSQSAATAGRTAAKAFPFISSDGCALLKYGPVFAPLGTGKAMDFVRGEPVWSAPGAGRSASRRTAGTSLDLATNSAIVRSAETGEPFVVLDDPDTGGYRVARLEVWELQKGAALETCRFVAAYENGAEMQRAASRKTAGPDPVWTPEKIDQRSEDEQPARDKWKSMNPDASTSTAANSMSFEDWMAKVDKACEAATYLSTADLADCPYMDWYEDGVKPEAAAKRAIKRDGGGTEGARTAGASAVIQPNQQYPGTYDLVVDGKVMVEAESMQVCDNIKEAMEGGGPGNDEAADVARTIVQSTGRMYTESDLRR